MNLTIFGLSLGTLPGWVPIWVVPAAIIHFALFVALVVPAWVALARARSGGPLALVLILPVLGLLILCPVFMNRVLPYAYWGRFWGILVLIPGLNIFFLWIFAFAPWKRRYIPLDQEEYSDPVTGLGGTGLGPRKGAPRPDGRSRDPVSQPGDAQTMMQGKVAAPFSGEPGAAAASRTAAPVSAPPARTGPPSEPPQATMLAGPQPLDEPVAPTPPIPARSQREPLSAPPIPPAAPPRTHERAPDRTPDRTHDLTIRNQPPPEAATMRMSAPPRAGGRAWRLVGANDVAAQIDFTVQEAALLESESGLLVGRSARANFVIDHDSVSRNHARFLIDRGALVLEDLDSMNGTWVDGKKLDANAPVPLQPNGIVEIGKLALRVTGG